MARNGKLSSKQEQFVQCLLAHHTVAAAAKICKVGKRTAYRWNTDPDVQSALKTARKDAYNATMDKLVSLVSSAILELGRTLADDEEAHATKLRAVQLILTHAHMHMVDGEVDERIALIEAALDGRR